jgi:ketosteroid isomerase-like protein
VVIGTAQIKPIEPTSIATTSFATSSAFTTWTSEPEEFIEGGDQVVVIVKTRMRPRGSSAEIENRTGHLWTIRDGTVLSMRFFAKPEQALEAAGVRG